MATGLKVLPVLHEKHEDETNPQCSNASDHPDGRLMASNRSVGAEKGHR